MQLITHEIRVEAEANFPKGNDPDQNVVAKFFNPTGGETWYLMNTDPEDRDYCWGIAKTQEIEMGSFSLSELEDWPGRMGLKIERDLYFTPRSARSIWEDLQAGKHV